MERTILREMSGLGEAYIVFSKEFHSKKLRFLVVLVVTLNSPRGKIRKQKYVSNIYITVFLVTCK